MTLGGVGVGGLAVDAHLALGDAPQEDGAEVERPHAVVDLLQGDALPGERLRDEEQPGAEADRAGGGHALDREVPRVLGRQQALGVGPRRRRVARPRHLAA